MQHCLCCNKQHGSYEWTVVYSNKRPFGAKKKLYRIGVICEDCERKYGLSSFENIPL